MDLRAVVTSDLQADLDQIADEVDDHSQWHFTDSTGTCLACDVVERLRHFSDDRDIDAAPRMSEIIAWLEADPDHVVERWNARAGMWVPSSGAVDVVLWRARLGEHDDQRQYGYRLGTREPATERVRLDQIMGRTLPGRTSPILYAANHDCGWQAYADRQWYVLDVDDDGTVEVLRVDQ